MSHAKPKGGSWMQPRVPDGMTPCRECQILTTNETYLCDDCTEELESGHVKIKYSLSTFRGQAEKPGVTGKTPSTGGSYGDTKRKRTKRDPRFNNRSGMKATSWIGHRKETVVTDNVFEVIE